MRAGTRTAFRKSHAETVARERERIRASRELLRLLDIEPAKAPKSMSNEKAPGKGMSRVYGKGLGRIPGEAADKADRAKMLTELDLAHEQRPVKLPYLKFLDPAHQRVKTS